MIDTAKVSDGFKLKKQLVKHTTMLEELLKNIKTRKIETKTDIYCASKLTSHYCYYKTPPSAIQKLLNDDRWVFGELLTDLVINPKNRKDGDTRTTAGFVLLSEGEVSKKVKAEYDDFVPKHLVVRLFAVEPWFDINTAVTWVKYRMKNILASNKEFVSCVWSVDEYDTPLQEALKAQNFKAVKSLELPVGIYFQSDNMDETITRIVFSLEED